VVTLVATARRVANPSAKGRMLDRGAVITLEPERYEGHAKLQRRLLRSGWSLQDPPATEQSVPQPTTPRLTSQVEELSSKSDTFELLPHQRQVIEDLKNRSTA
jgi:hypothetical protein